jgi:serine/threonine protein kinase
MLAAEDESAECIAKVADFGLAIQLHSKFGVSRNQSFQWLAPEVLLEKPFTHKSDVYRCGVSVCC